MAVKEGKQLKQAEKDMKDVNNKTKEILKRRELNYEDNKS